ncbi:MAG: HAD-IA family hydrolase [Nanoarchaeota archaeon]|nr:HAD-IA family hydrolase [Nanoarchaeota archaeon]
MKGEIKAIIFDIGGVLQARTQTRFNRKELHLSGVHELVAKKLKISIDQYFDAIDSYYVKSIEGSISKKELLENLSRNLKTPREKIEKLYYKAYSKKFKQDKLLLSTAKKLKKNYKVAILSDQWHLSKDAHYPKNFQKLFNPVVISCDVGIRKPAKEIYKLILKKLKLKPNQVIFIDNQAWNTIPAHALGMNTILHIDTKKTIQELKQFGVKL